MLYSDDGLSFEWGIDGDVVWILDKGEGRSALISMEVILRFLEKVLGSCEDVNIICRNFMGKWDVVIKNHRNRGYEIRSLGDAKTYCDARSALLRIFGEGVKVRPEKSWEGALNITPGNIALRLDYQPMLGGWGMPA